MEYETVYDRTMINEPTEQVKKIVESFHKDVDMS